MAWGKLIHKAYACSEKSLLNYNALDEVICVRVFSLFIFFFVYTQALWLSTHIERGIESEIENEAGSKNWEEERVRAIFYVHYVSIVAR